MEKHPKFAELAENIHGGLENMLKWYRSTDDSLAYFVCLRMYTLNTIVCRNDTNFSWTVLDPKWKDWYVKKMWDSEAFDKAMAKFRSLVSSSLPSAQLCYFLGSSLIFQYETYYDEPASPPVKETTARTTESNKAPTSASTATQYGMSWMTDAVGSDEEDSAADDDKFAELKRYLSLLREKDVVDVVAWWGVSITIAVLHFAVLITCTAYSCIRRSSPSSLGWHSTSCLSRGLHLPLSTLR